MFFVKLKSFIRDYFTLTSRERKGAIVLVSIIGIQILVLIWMHYLDPPLNPVITTHRMQLAAFEKRIADSTADKTGNYRKVFEPKVKTVLPLVPFDPNTITELEWMSFGLSQKQAQVIRNYISKGGRFWNKESVSKMYCISPELYGQLEPFITIPVKETTARKPFEKSTLPEKKVLKLDINTADTTQLAELPLIGPGRARMIFKYRERLGGFASEYQLLEVYTIDSATFEAIRPHIVVDPVKIRKVNFNSDSLSHPYLSRKAVSAIIAFRKQHGNFIDINDLRKVVVLDQQKWSKVAPYAVFE